MTRGQKGISEESILAGREIGEGEAVTINNVLIMQYMLRFNNEN